MTLNTNDVRNEYTATGVQTVFNYTFKIYDSTDLNVYVTPAGQECSDGDLTTSYTVSGVGLEDGGSITLTTPTTLNDLVTIVSSIPTSRTTDYQNSGDFRPDTVNDDFDRTVSLVKQAEELGNRSLQFPECLQGVTSLSLPEPASQRFLRWKTDRSGLENVTLSSEGIAAEVSVTDYDALRGLTSSTYTDGQVIFVTNDGIAGSFIVKTGTVTDNGGTLIVFTDDSNRYTERDYAGSVNVEWFGVVPNSASDQTSLFHAAFGGEGSTPDDWSVFIPNGTYKTDVLKVYRSGETLKNFTLEGESQDGVYFEDFTASKGFVFGEPDTTDLLWGSASAINVEGITVRNLKHKYNDIGMWFVYCRDVLVENISGGDLVCLAMGNDAADDCEDVTIRNVSRFNDGRNVSPDAWYSIGLYRVTGFTISGFNNKGYLSAASGTGGAQISINECTKGTITGNVIRQTTQSGNGIALLVGTTDVTVVGNEVQGCGKGVVLFSTTTTNNTISANHIFENDIGLDQNGARDNTISGNAILGNTTADIYGANSDSLTNRYIANDAATYSMASSISGNQTFISGKYFRKHFIPAYTFVKYHTTDAVPEIDITDQFVTDSVGSSRLIGHMPAQGNGEVKDVVFHFNRLVISTGINCYVHRISSGGAFVAVGEVLDTTASTGLVEAPLALYGGYDPLTVNALQSIAAIIIPTAANLLEFIGVSYDYKPTGDYFVED